MMDYHDEPPLFIMRAVQAADRAFFENVMNEKRLTSAETCMARKVLRDPTWRPLCELAMNGVTTFEGALILKACGLVQKSPFIVRSGHERGTPVAGVDFSDEGRVRVEDYLIASDNEALASFSAKLAGSVTDYAAIDTGAGLVATRSALEGALQFDDWELLSRLRHIPDGGPLFPSPPENKDCLDRDEYFEYLNEWTVERYGWEIMDLTCPPRNPSL